MGLRINTNISSVRALRTLSVNDRAQAKSLERLSTGLRINRGADDPSGLVISEQLRSQVAGLGQAVNNAQNASNLLSVADAALGEVSSLLVQIQDSIVFAMNTGGATPEQIAAEQDAVDQAVSAIDRIASNTRFADRPLLNGSVQFQISSSLPEFFDDVEIKSANFSGSGATQEFVVNELVNPQRAQILITSFQASASGATIRISGNRGTEDVVLQGSANTIQIQDAVNGVAGFTGVYASGATTGPVDTLLLRSEGFGPNSFVKIEMVEGSFEGQPNMGVRNLEASLTNGQGAYIPDFGATNVSNTAMTVGMSSYDAGLDGQVSHAGQIFIGDGNHYEIQTKKAHFSFNTDPDLITSDSGSLTTVPPFSNGSTTQGSFTITVSNTGLNFQLNDLPMPSDKFSVGIQAVTTATLGFDPMTDRISGAVSGFTTVVESGGFLSSLRTGSGNDLTQDPENALKIVKASVGDVASLRGFLGAVQADTIEPNISALGGRD